MDMMKSAPVRALSETFLVRHMRAEDLPALEWGGEYTHFRRQFQMVFQDYQEGQAIPWLVERHEDQQIIGQVFVLLVSRYRTELADGESKAYLYSIRVKDAFRNRGIGRWLMAVVEADLLARGYGVATLNVARDNLDAYRFYLRLGYRVVAAEPGRWSYLDHNGKRQFVNEPAWRMEKRLVPEPVRGSDE